MVFVTLYKSTGNHCEAHVKYFNTAFIQMIFSGFLIKSLSGMLKVWHYHPVGVACLIVESNLHTDVFS